MMGFRTSYTLRAVPFSQLIIVSLNVLSESDNIVRIYFFLRAVLIWDKITLNTIGEVADHPLRSTDTRKQNGIWLMMVLLLV